MTADTLREADYWNRAIDTTLKRLQTLKIDLAGATPVDEWPRKIDEPVELLVIHPHGWLHYDPVETGFVAWCKGSWTDFNKGGWTWYGLAGRVCFVRPLSQPEIEK